MNLKLQQKKNPTLPCPAITPIPLPISVLQLKETQPFVPNPALPQFPLSNNMFLPISLRLLNKSNDPIQIKNG